MPDYTRTQAPTPSEISVFSRPAREVSRQLGLGRQEARSLSREWDRRERTKSPAISSNSTIHELHSDTRPPRHSRPPSEANSTHTAPSARNSSSRPQWRTQTQTQPAPSLIESSITGTRSRSNSRNRHNPDLSVKQQMHSFPTRSRHSNTTSAHHQSHCRNMDQQSTPSIHSPPSAYSSDQSDRSSITRSPRVRFAYRGQQTWVCTSCEETFLENDLPRYCYTCPKCAPVTQPMAFERVDSTHWTCSSCRHMWTPQQLKDFNFTCNHQQQLSRPQRRPSPTRSWHSSPRSVSSEAITHHSALTEPNSDIYSFTNNNPTDLVEDTAMLVDSILQLYQPSTMKTTMEWKLRMGSKEDLKAKFSKCRKQQKQFAQKVNLQQGNSGAQKSFVALYEHAFGTIPGTFYMDHVMDQFKMVTDMMATQPPRDNQAPTPDIRLPKLMALMEKQENVVVFWEQQYHSYQAARDAI